jgi:hypothetical protein
MTPPFMPVGPVARWKIVYQLVQPLAVGEVVTYESIGAALDLHPDRDRHTIQMATRRALKELLDVDHRAAQPITNVGYRVAMPAEHLGIAETKNKRAGRQLKAGHDVSTKVDLNGVDPNVRQAIQLIAQGFARQMEINRRVAAKQEEHDTAIDLLMRRVEKIERGED